jgi:hypothetical protein
MSVQNKKRAYKLLNEIIRLLQAVTTKDKQWDWLRMAIW